ncbi:hypothetical protein KP509_10G026000 [Ceratopteris richardii]|uniref:Uncharacterized protein n=1 Tax=Ceratopteris richardii TaxID=49495 RepID=A0A8T2TZB6_CERRI|nr:hypothetical protein KP509_10G026000 [Ceratopteris richardii]
MWPLLSGGQAVTVGMHEAPIKAIEWIPEMNLLATGSWDKTLKFVPIFCLLGLNNERVVSYFMIEQDNLQDKGNLRTVCFFMWVYACYRYWDLRQSTPVHTQVLPDKCYAISVRHPLMVIATAERHIVIFNLASPQTEYKRIQSPLKYMTRCIATFPDKQGYLIGSIEGRVAVQHIEEAQQSKNFTFKCHRDNNDIYAVNSINFHPVHSTFATAGSDGAYNFWDKENKQRLKAMQRCNQPIPCSTFNFDGTIFAYAVSYDWSKGAENHNPSTAKNYILLHPTQEAEIKAKPRATPSGGKK